MRGMVRLFPVAVAAGIGLVDGTVADNDARSGRVALTKQYSSYLEAGLLAAGFAMETWGRFSPDLTQPMLIGGTVLLAKKVGQKYLRPASAAAAGVAYPMQQVGAGSAYPYYPRAGSGMEAVSALG